MWSKLAKWILSQSAQQHVPRLKISDRYPNVNLTTQFGNTLKFREAFVNDGRALLLNTMFTTCRGSCPTTGATLQYLRKALNPVFHKRLTIVSITLEPKIDTANVLRNYAAQFDADRIQPDLPDWFFVTSTQREIDLLRRALGFYDLDPRVDSDVTQHASLLLCGNSTSDRWSAFPAGLQKHQLIQSIRRVAGFTYEQKYGLKA